MSEITKQYSIEELELLKYERRKRDFEVLSTKMMVRLKLQKDNGILSSDKLFSIEKAFEKVELAGSKGRWKTALKELNLIETVDVDLLSVINEVRLVMEEYNANSY